MKKIKKRLIITITIILIVVILAIIFISNIINNNNLSNRGYLATTKNASSTLVASYIKKGITIGGVTGTLEVLDTSDADAIPEDISWGKTGYVNGEKITGTRIDTITQAKEAQQDFNENTILLDDYGNAVTVPKGFKITEDSATSVTGGVVIEDVSAEGTTEYTKGSQFVWIPIGNVITDTNGNIMEIELGRYIFDSSGKETLVQSAKEYEKETQLKIASTSSNYYRELLKTTSSANAKAKDIADFIDKAQESKGYYIGRYELGDASGIYRENSTSDSNTIACKKDIYPYNYITQTQASSLCQDMYRSNNFESDLINSYSWDTALVFIQKFSGDKNYSQQLGINTTMSLQKCGNNILNSNYVDDMDETKDKRCNIYDMASGVQEWCTETNNQAPCTARGGNFETFEFPTSSRGFYEGYIVTHNNIWGTGRPILYL